MVKNRYNALLEGKKISNDGVKTGGTLTGTANNSPYISQSNGISSSYVGGGAGGGGGLPKTETIIPDFGESGKSEYVYTGPNYMDQLRSAYNSIYNSNIDAANSAYARLKEEAERQALIKKGQARTRQITMEKYVPETLRAMGLKNNGLAADALIGIDNNYTNYLMQALAQEENMKAEASRFLADQTRAANNQKALWDIELLGKQQDAWTTLQQMAASGNYGEEFLQNYGYSWGFDENQVGDTLDVYKEVLAKQEAEESKANSSLMASEASTYFSGGLSLERMKMELAQKGYTADQIALAEKYFKEQEDLTTKEGQAAIFNDYATNMLNGNLYSIGALLDEAETKAKNGELTSTDYARLQQIYTARHQLDMDTISDEEYEKIVEAIMNGTYVSPKQASDLNSHNEDTITEEELDEVDPNVTTRLNEKVIDINSANFNNSDFGTFVGVNNADSKQNAYLNQIIRDAKAGLIEKGQLIIPNYGNRGSGRDTVYMYLGNGRFVKTYNTASTYQGWGKDIYVPNGYKENWLGNIKKE